jgi:hypothetical protein
MTHALILLTCAWILWKQISGSSWQYFAAFETKPACDKAQAEWSEKLVDGPRRLQIPSPVLDFLCLPQGLHPRDVDYLHMGH